MRRKRKITRHFQRQKFESSIEYRVNHLCSCMFVYVLNETKQWNIRVLNSGQRKYSVESVRPHKTQQFRKQWNIFVLQSGPTKYRCRVSSTTPNPATTGGSSLSSGVFTLSILGQETCVPSQFGHLEPSRWCNACCLFVICVCLFFFCVMRILSRSI